MNLDKNWVHYLTRPYTLFGASLWRVWYSSERTKKVFGTTMPDTLCIEEHKDVVRRYAVKEQLEHFKCAVENTCINEPQKCVHIFQRGIELNTEAVSLLKNRNIHDFKKAVDFLIELTLHATIFPFLAYETLHKNKQVSDMHAEALALCEQLRAYAYWSQVVDEIVIPLAKRMSGDDVDLMTFQEVLNNEFRVIHLRKREQQENKRFVYQYLDGKELVEWVTDPLDIMKKLEKVELGSELKGRCACAGKVRGIARLVLTNDITIPFNKGDILGHKAQDLLKRDLSIISPKKRLELKLDQTESDVFSLAKENNIIALTDDIHAARKAAELLKLQTHPSFSILLLLYKENKIKKDELISDIETILKQRNWLEGALWAYALQLIKELK